MEENDQKNKQKSQDKRVTFSNLVQDDHYETCDEDVDNCLRNETSGLETFKSDNQLDENRRIKLIIKCPNYEQCLNKGNLKTGSNHRTIGSCPFNSKKNNLSQSIKNNKILKDSNKIYSDSLSYTDLTKTNYENRIHELEQKIIKLENEKSLVSFDLIMVELEDKKTEINKKQRIITELETKAKANDQALKSIGTLQQSFEKNRNDIKNLKENIGALTTNVNQLENENSSLRIENNAFQLELNQCKKNLETEIKNKQRVITDFESNCSSLNYNLQSSLCKNTSDNNTIIHLNQKVNSLVLNIDQLANENSTFRNQSNAYQSELNQFNKNMETEMASRQRVLNDLETKTVSLNESLKSNSFFKLNTEKSKKDIIGLNLKINSLLANVDKLKSEKSSIQLKLNLFTKSLPVFEGIKLENTSLLQRIDILNQTIYRQSCKIERLENKIETDETSMDEFNSRRKAERVGKRKNVDENLTDCPICSQKGFKNVNIHIGHMHKCKQCRELFTECTCH